jgi:hypothetical protein
VKKQLILIFLIIANFPTITIEPQRFSFVNVEIYKFYAFEFQDLKPDRAVNKWLPI